MVVAAVSLAALAGCAADDATPEPRAATEAPAARQESAVLPVGWRWESFGGVEVGVPGDWGWDNGSQRLGQWCVDDRRSGPPPPAVGRPGLSSMVGCPEAEPGAPDPSTLVAETGVIVAFDWALDDTPPPEAAGDQEVRRIGQVDIRVNARPALRERILATAHPVDVDAHGCASELPSGFVVGAPPVAGADVSTLVGVTALAACRYTVPLPDVAGAMPRLLSSTQLVDDPAADAVAAIAAAPKGGGPDRPGSCLRAWSYGDEMIVAHVESDAGRSDVHVYYSGCDHNGFDDGTSVRSLTRAAVQPLLAGGNQPWSWSGAPAKTAILQQR